MSDGSTPDVDVKIDLSRGRFRVRTRTGDVTELLEKIEHLFGKYIEKTTVGDSPSMDLMNTPPIEALSEDSSVAASTTTGEGSKPKKATSTRSKNYKPTDLGLDDVQRNVVREFFAAKEPAGQETEIAVLTTKIKQLTGKDEFSADDIFTALRIVARPIPKNLDGVISNMKSNGRGDRKAGKFVVNYLTEDFVNHHMEKKKS